MRERIQLQSEEQSDLEWELCQWFEANKDRFPIPEDGDGWEIEVRTREGRLMAFQVSGICLECFGVETKEYEVSCAWQEDAWVPPIDGYH